MSTWFVKRPHRLTQEEDALQKAGVIYKIDEVAKALGVIRITLTVQGDNPYFDLPEGTEDLELIAVFPDTYPFFRPNVYAKQLNLSRHQNLIDKNLCLLPRATENWLPSMLLADLLSTQLKRLLIKGGEADPEKIRQDASEQAEPASEYYASSDNPVLFDPPNIEFSRPSSVELLGRIKIGIPSPTSYPSRLAVVETTLNATGEKLTAPKTIQALFAKTIEGLLFRLPDFPPLDHKTALIWLRKTLEEQKNKLHLPGKPVTLSNGTLKNVVGFCFPEEREKGSWQNGWLFLIEGSMWPIDNQQKIRKDKPSIPRNYYARASSTNQNQSSVRIPKLAPLARKKVSIVGLGAIGSFVALELARNGVEELVLMDYDTVEAPTTIRWPLGLAAAGIKKTVALANFIEKHYPFTKVKVLDWKIGNYRLGAEGTRLETPKSEDELIEELFSDTSVVVDATAEVGIHNFLNLEAKERGLPYLSLYASPGGYGGVVMRALPEKGGCWMCMKYMQEDNEEMIPRLDETSGVVQPPGCGDFTFTGASFDLEQISLAAVRLVVSTLCAQEEEGYPDVDWDIAVLNLFDKNDKPTPPDWKVYPLPVHPNCPYCN